MKRHNISKKDLKNKIKFNLGIPNSLSEKIIESFFDIISEGLIRDGEVKIASFGKFKILNKKQRIGRNPKTKEVFTISKRRVVTFYPSLLLKRKINEQKEHRSIQND